MGIRRTDFREVKPTADEVAAWRKKNPRTRPPYRAEHIPCGKRMWYSGIGIGAHLRACKALKSCGCDDRSVGPENCPTHGAISPHKEVSG